MSILYYLLAASVPAFLLMFYLRDVKLSLFLSSIVASFLLLLFSDPEIINFLALVGVVMLVLIAIVGSGLGIIFWLLYERLKKNK
jgi:membrane protein YqaA with SNARE-associated domain